MSNYSFIFGNVDEDGKLDNEELDKDLISSLEVGGNEYLDRILSETLDLNSEIETGNKSTENIVPRADAVDYSEIQEFANEYQEILRHEQMQPIQIILPSNPPEFSNANVRKPTSYYVDKPSIISSQKQASPHQAKLSQILTNVSQGKIRFTDIFGPLLVTPDENVKQTPLKKNIIFLEDEGYKISKDDRDLFFKENDSSFQWENPAILEKLTREDSFLLKSVDKTIENKFLSLEIDKWEDKIVWDSDTSQDESLISKIPKYKKMGNEFLDQGDWLDNVLIEEGPKKVPQKTFEDPAITLDVQNLDFRKSHGIEKSQLDRFNLSGDAAYEPTKTLKTDRVRQVVGPVVLEHALPATKLHFQYYKPVLTTKELRSFHRPHFKVPLHTEIKITRLKVFKKKKARGKEPSELMKSSKSISLRDTSPFVLVEYSEEYPIVMQNAGMASMIYNYYRKKNEKDAFVPKMATGAAHLIEPVDASPFFGLGDVEPGQTISAIYNHLYRAPIFKHDVPQTDFLLIKYSMKGRTKFYIREIPNIFVAGQCYPLQEIPRPQSRKIVQATKGRLQVVAYRLMRKDPLGRLKFSSLMKAFPCYDEMEIRNKIKEYLQYAKKGENTGWWKINPKFTLPTEEGIRKLSTPELVCLMESSHAGQQRLNDSGYGNLIFNDNDDGDKDMDDEASQDIEVMMAPWITSKNFVLAAQGKGMVQLYGPGDPSGCGEAFSFLRASMKEMFFREGETEQAKSAFISEKSRTTYHRFSITEQQQIYKAEIKRIWGNQLRSLDGSKISEEPEIRSQKIVELEDDISEIKVEGNVKSSPLPNSPPSIIKDEDQYSDVESSDNIFGGKNRILVINRLVRNLSTNELEWKSEVITDMRVMSAYLRQHTLFEKAATVTDPNVTAIEEDEKTIRKRRIAEYLSNLRLSKSGKRPGVDGVDLNVATDGSGQVTVKIPMGSQSSSKKRKTEGFEPSAMKLVLKRRSPEVELSAIFDKLIKELMSAPETWAFCRPVSKEFYADYYEVVSNPKTLKDIENDVKNQKYLSPETFMADLELMSANCKLYNGEVHSLYHITRNVISKAEAYMKEHKEEIDQLIALIHEPEPVSESANEESGIQFSVENDSSMTTESNVNQEAAVVQESEVIPDFMDESNIEMGEGFIF